MRPVDEENTEARRVAIIEAAARCLSRNGVAKTSIGEICKEAGIRSGHLYYYFSSKEALLEAIFTYRRDETAAAIEHMLDDGDLVSQIVDIHVQAENRRLQTGLTPAARVELECYFSRTPSEIRIGGEGENRLITVLTKAATQAVQNGRLPSNLDIGTFVNSIILIWQGLSYSRLASDFDIDTMRRAVELLIAPWANEAQRPHPNAASQQNPGTVA